MLLTNTIRNILRKTGVELTTPPAESVLVRTIARNFDSRTATRIAKKLNIDIRQIWDTQRHYLPLHKAIIGAEEASVIRLLHEIYTANPAGRGLFWSCAMESAIRIFNLRVLSSHYQSKAMDQFILLERSYILNNLETHSTNNHILFNYLGLYLSQALSTPSEHANEFSREQIEHQLRTLIRKQFFAEGTNFEASTGYHFLGSEALAIVTLLEPDFQSLLPAEKSWYHGSRNFMACMLTEQDDFLAIGDDDSGSCLFPIRQQRLRRLQLELYKIAFQEQIIGSEPPRAFSFSDFGLACIQGTRSKLVLAATRNNQNGVGGHAHNDKLAISLNCDGVWLIGDSGTGSYSWKRNYWRSASAHSTIVIQKEEPNPFTRNRFELHDHTQAKITHSDSTNLRAVSNYGGRKINRSIFFSNGSYHINDSITLPPKNGPVVSNIIVQRKPIPIATGNLNETKYSLPTDTGHITLQYNGTARISKTRRSPAYGATTTAYAISLIWPEGTKSIRWQLNEY